MPTKLKPDDDHRGPARRLARQALAPSAPLKVRNGVPLFLPKPRASKPGLRIVSQLRDDACVSPMKNPPHPGDFIRTEFVEPAGLSVMAAAKALHVSRPALSSLLSGEANLSGDMALRIEKAFGVKMDTLMRMQASYDIAQTRKREREVRVRRFHRATEARQ